MRWQQVRLDDTLADWVSQTILVLGDDATGVRRYAVAELKPGRGDDSCKVRWMLPDPDGNTVRPVHTDRVTAGTNLRDWALAYPQLSPVKAVSLPAHTVRFTPRERPLSARQERLFNQIATAALGAILGAIVGGVIREPILVLALSVIGAIGGLLYARNTPQLRRLHGQGKAMVDQGVYRGGRLGDKKVRRYVRDARPFGVRAAVTGAVTTGNEVLDTYSNLLSDIVYRIENPALFDDAVPTTRRFTLAILAWEDAGEKERPAAAAQLRASFEAARQYAEGVGLGHYSEADRAAGRRLLAASRVAVDEGATAGERSAARRRIVELLGSLALYYLPEVDPDRPELVRAPRQLGRGQS